MFLAIEEIKRSKLRYGLILGLLILVAYLVFFLTGLAYGLMQQNRAAIDKWQADKVVLAADADKLLAASRIEQQLLEEVDADRQAALYYQAGTVWLEGSSDKVEKERAAFFGIEADGFLMPDLVAGRAFQEAYEVIVADSLLASLELELGDQLTLAGSEQALTIVGVTDRATISVTPVIYLATRDYQELFPMVLANAVVVRGDVEPITNDTLEVVSIGELINKLPGYTAQNLTFGFMIGFLVVISAVIIGIFIYVLTAQKAAMIGLMKIQGLSNSYIGASVLGQTVVLTGSGTVIGLGLTYFSSLMLPAAVPFENNWLFYGVVSLALVGISVLGASFSVGSIVKVDPLRHIG